MAYRHYLTESIRLAPQNKWFTKSFSDLLESAKDVDNRSGEEIVADVLTRGGLTLA